MIVARKDMFGHRFGARAEKLKAGAWRALEHTDFEEKIGEIFHK
jgi:hypothetical protein